MTAAREDFTERRHEDAERRASGWRWGASRADRRKHPALSHRPEQRALPNTLCGRRLRNRRKGDRDDAPFLAIPRHGLPKYLTP